MPGEEDVYEIEVLEGELVAHPQIQLREAGNERLPLQVVQPTAQTAVALVTGFVAGAATMALLRRYGQAKLERAAAVTQALEPRPGQARTFVVHVRRVG